MKNDFRLKVLFEKAYVTQTEYVPLPPWNLSSFSLMIGRGGFLLEVQYRAEL